MKILISTIFNIIFVGIGVAVFGVELDYNPLFSVTLSGVLSILVIILLSTLKVTIRADIELVFLLIFAVFVLGVFLHSLIMAEFVANYVTFYPDFSFWQQFLVSLSAYLVIIAINGLYTKKG